ncbi:hypothetical protein ES702_04192 [subsurface metagenome]
MNKDESITTYHVTQCYLEMARAVYTKWCLPTAKQFSSDRELKTLVGQFSFLIVSLTVIYSYLAIEAWANYYLHEIWRKSRFNSGKKYPAFPQKYRQINEFTKLKDTELKELKERIKVLCDSYQIPRIDRSNPKLWRDFNELLEEARHFIIHPFPDPKKFQECMEIVQEKHGLRKWTKIAEGIISHFFINKNKKLPNWLTQNKFFKIEKFELVR